jgi:hypothetical protein
MTEHVQIKKIEKNGKEMIENYIEKRVNKKNQLTNNTNK